METRLAQLDSVMASLNYTAETEEKPAHYLYETPEGFKKNLPQRDFHPMPIHDSRKLEAPLSLDKQGFLFTEQHSKVQNFYDAKEVKDVYFPEACRLVQEITGAVKALAFDHNVRCAPMAKAQENQVSRPVKYVHNDYTLLSAPERLRDIVGEAEAAQWEKQRYAIINVWRPIKNPVEESPLAVCNAESMEMEDFIPTDLKYQDRTGEIYSVRFNPNHQWFYFSHMQPQEVMLLKCYDSAEDGRARFTAHSAFKDPTSPPHAKDRESIEVRILACFEEA